MAEANSTVAYRDIPGFPGYRVGDDGSVWSARTIGPRGVGHGRGGVPIIGNVWRPLTVKKLNNYCGHRYVSLRCEGKSYNRLVHRLVLEAFVGPCPEGKEGTHDDGDPSNNRLGNLAWKTPKENAADRKRHGTQARGERMGMAVLTDAQAAAIMKRLDAGEVQRPMAAEFGVSVQTINNLARGKTFKHLRETH